MSQIIDRVPPRRSRRGRAPKYDWPAILDGRVHRFRPDEVPSTPRNFARQVRAAAEVYGIRVSITVRAAQGVYVEAHLD